MMRTNRFFFALILLTIIGAFVTTWPMTQQAQTMNHDPLTTENESRQLASQVGSGQSGSGTGQVNTGNSTASDLGKYPDKPISSIPTKPVSLRYIVEHRSALNGKTIIVQGIVVRTLGPSAGNTSSGEQSMANPQPRVLLADNLRKRRDRNYDLTVLLSEGERGYAVGQTAKIKVRVDASKIAVVMRKLS